MGLGGEEHDGGRGRAIEESGAPAGRAGGWARRSTLGNWEQRGMDGREEEERDRSDSLLQG